jgi:hypothetical protein
MQISNKENSLNNFGIKKDIDNFIDSDKDNYNENGFNTNTDVNSYIKNNNLLFQTFNKNVNSPTSYNFSFNNSRIIDNSGSNSKKTEGKVFNETEYFPTITKFISNDNKNNCNIEAYKKALIDIKNNNNNNYNKNKIKVNSKDKYLINYNYSKSRSINKLLTNNDESNYKDKNKSNKTKTNKQNNNYNIYNYSKVRLIIIL